MTLTGCDPGVTADVVDALDLETALSELGELSHRQEKIVEMRFFAGMTNEEVAEVLGISARTVMYDWRMARAWLRTRLQSGESEDD